MAIGQTVWFDPYKGYGFITGEDGNDYFAYWKNIQMDGYKKLIPKKNVTFTPMQENNQNIATEIRYIK